MAGANTTAQTATACRMRIVGLLLVRLMNITTNGRVRLLYQTLQLAGAIVSDFVLLDPEHIQHAEQQIRRRYRLGGEMQMPAALKLSARSSRQNVGNIVVQVLVRIAHIGAVKHQGV